MTQAVMDGNSHFYVTLDGVDGIFDFAIPGQLGIVGCKEGDTITFKYVKGDTTNSVQEIDTSKNSVTIDKPSGDAAKTDEVRGNSRYREGVTQRQFRCQKTAGTERFNRESGPPRWLLSQTNDPCV